MRKLCQTGIFIGIGNYKISQKNDIKLAEENLIDLFSPLNRDLN